MRLIFLKVKPRSRRRATASSPSTSSPRTAPSARSTLLLAMIFHEGPAALAGRALRRQGRLCRRRESCGDRARARTTTCCRKTGICHCTVGSLAGRADREASNHAPTQRADRLLGDGDDLPVLSEVVETPLSQDRTHPSATL